MTFIFFMVVFTSMQIREIMLFHYIYSSTQFTKYIHSTFTWLAWFIELLFLQCQVTTIYKIDMQGKCSVIHSVQFSSVSQSCLTLCDPMNCSTPGLPVHHHLPEFTQTYVHRVGDAIQPSYPQSSPSPPAPNSSQHQSLFQWVNSLHEVAKVLEFQL